MHRVEITVFTSAIWQMTSTVVGCGESRLVVDPGYFPREIEAIAASLPRRAVVEALLFTHGHFDHVVGHGAFPEAPVYAAPPLVAAVAAGAPAAARALAEAARFDAQYYVDRPWPYAWPRDLRPLEDGGAFNIGDLDLEVFHLPGHAADCLALRAGDRLIVGDYLSPLEIPFVDDLAAYRRSLRRLEALIDASVAAVVPGHGPVLSAEAARRILREDRRYLDALQAARDSGDPAAGAAVPLPRARGVEEMARHHRDNLEKIGLRLP